MHVAFSMAPARGSCPIPTAADAREMQPPWGSDRSLQRTITISRQKCDLLGSWRGSCCGSGASSHFVPCWMEPEAASQQSPEELGLWSRNNQDQVSAGSTWASQGHLHVGSPPRCQVPSAGQLPQHPWTHPLCLVQEAREMFVTAHLCKHLDRRHPRTDRQCPFRRPAP